MNYSPDTDYTDLYYKHTYWNDLPEVSGYLNKLATGNPKTHWITDFKKRYAKKPFAHGLFLNCGNGWVEREFIDRGIATKATAFDFSLKLINEAESKRKHRRIHYFQADANTVEFEENQFDLIVNVASLHHVRYINHLCVQLLKGMKKDGLFVNYDYIGPARNQYSKKHWDLVREVNDTLPVHIKKAPLRYPYLVNILEDPSEAIHSDLILKTVSRYFSTKEKHDLNGGIAYILLSANEKIFAMKGKEKQNAIDHILQLDKKYSDSNVVPPLFSYFVVSPTKNVLQHEEQLGIFQDEENRRESSFPGKYGVYCTRDLINLLFTSLLKKIKKRIKN